MRYLRAKWGGTHSSHAKGQLAKHRVLGTMNREQCALALAEKELYETPNE